MLKDTSVALNNFDDMDQLEKVVMSSKDPETTLHEIAKSNNISPKELMRQMKKNKSSSNHNSFFNKFFSFSSKKELSNETDAKKLGIHVAFRNITYSIKNELEILKGISGSFIPGRMVAIMGPSGSGKTSLLDVLSSRKNTGIIKGDILFNGNKLTTEMSKNLIGYVEQFDTLVDELTVRQMLSYTAELKLPPNTTSKEKEMRVDEVLRMLNLESCADTIIGNGLQRGISGGQLKRVNIGLALITRPLVLFLDEPTTGLDSRTANEVIELLRDLAEDGRTVVCTIHSPTGHAFMRFNDLYMLHGGKTIYDGPVLGAQAYFEDFGFKLQSEASLPEWIVDISSSLNGTKFSKSFCGIENGLSKQDFVVNFDKSELKTTAEDRILLASEKRYLKTKGLYKNPSAFQNLKTLLKYRMVAHYKDGQFIGVRFGDKVVFSLLILSLYFGIGDEIDPESIISTSNLLYFIAALCGYGASAFVPSLTLERNLFYRELADGCYSPGTYYMAKFIEESVMATITSLVFCVIVYYGVSLQGSFGIFFFIYYLTTMIGIILAYAVAAIVPTMEAANALLPTLITVWMYFGGLFIVYDKIPKGWYWFSWTSFLRYSWGAMMLNQYQSSEMKEIPIFFDNDGNSQTILEFYGFEGSIMGSIGACIGIFICLICFFSIVGVLALVFIRHDKR